MSSLAQTPPPSVGNFQSIREYLYQGPPIYMDHSEIPSRRWDQYEMTVDRIFKAPDAGHWLDGPLDQGWNKTLPRRRCQWDKGACRHEGPTWQDKLKRVLEQSATSLGIFFWILHITSALGFVIVGNASVSDDHSLERL